MKDTSKSSANSYLGLGLLAGLYGGFLKLATGYLCPACLLLTPLLITVGLWKKRLSRKASREDIAQ
jgi:hypothetical protein